MALEELSFETERKIVNGGYMGRTVWHGAAFIVEALLLLFFLVVSLTIFMTLFSNASAMGERNDKLANAVTLATNMAESFTANPAEANGTYESGEYEITCSVTPEDKGGGTLYTATIEVHNEGSTIYSLDVSSYKSGGGA